MAISSEKKENLKKKAAEEFSRLVTIFIYLAMLMVGFAIYRSLILAEYHISYFHFGYALLEAAVLAKVILIGEALHLGERPSDRPMIFTVLYKTLLFSMLVGVFTVLEHFVSGMLEGRNLAGIYASLADKGKDEILARVVVMFVSFIPLFALLEMGQMMGENQLHRLLFRRRTTPTVNPLPGGGVKPA